jgi:hypothetical protein
MNGCRDAAIEIISGVIFGSLFVWGIDELRAIPYLPSFGVPVFVLIGTAFSVMPTLGIWEQLKFVSIAYLAGWMVCGICFILFSGIQSTIIDWLSYAIVPFFVLIGKITWSVKKRYG